MLVLSRHRDESIIIGDDIVVTVVDIRGDKVRLGIAAPMEVSVHRQEVYEAIEREKRTAALPAPSPAALPAPADPLRSLHARVKRAVQPTTLAEELTAMARRHPELASAIDEWRRTLEASGVRPELIA